MKRIFYILTFLVFFTISVNAQLKNSKELTGNIQVDLKMLLPNGLVNADIMDGILQNPRRLQLGIKLQAAAKKNYSWFLDYLKKSPEGKPLPYHQNLGLTKKEYEEFLALRTSTEIVSTGKENIVIEFQGDTIHFRSHNKFADLDSLTIDIKNNTATFKQYKMIFVDTLNITSDDNGFKSKWKGYRWKFEDPKNLDINELKDYTTLNIKLYELIIGRLEKNGKTHITLKGTEVESGKKTVAFEIPVVF